MYDFKLLNRIKFIALQILLSSCFSVEECLYELAF